jgi:hypothetical protein
MKRVLSVMTAAVFAGALAVPVFAQEKGAPESAPATTAPAKSSSETMKPMTHHHHYHHHHLVRHHHHTMMSGSKGTSSKMGAETAPAPAAPASGEAKP